MRVQVLRVSALTSLSLLAVRGADARSFLQGQLSNDLRRVTPQRALLASCNSAQGRVQAILTLVERNDSILCIVPTSMVARLAARLRHYVLRSKVTLQEATGLALAALTARQAEGFVALPPRSPGACVANGALTVMRWWSADERYLLLAPEAEIQRLSGAEDDLLWKRADIAAGIPQVCPETHEQFVAQMLNLDLLGGISFDKGCYTGQEIIARTQYRGTIKRRMMRFAANCPAPPPGTRILHAGSHAGDVVDACVASADAGHASELLAVVSVERAHEPLQLDGIGGSSLVRLGLPYVIPQAEAA
jgi:folate-binding protein YgfZ